MNAIFSFTGIYFNIKNRPHHILSKDEAKVIFFKEIYKYKCVTGTNTKEIKIHENEYSNTIYTEA